MVHVQFCLNTALLLTVIHMFAKHNHDVSVTLYKIFFICLNLAKPTQYVLELPDGLFLRTVISHLICFLLFVSISGCNEEWRASTEHHTDIG